MSSGDVPRRRFVAGLAIVLLLGGALRGIYPTADPPWQSSVGITWHDEGPWVHNARNRALWGEWSTDAWNPMYLAPVFTALEYASFATFGVGHWQARLVSEVVGLWSVLMVAVGVAACGTRRAGLMAGGLLATNYVYVMWNRAALMEATMTAFIAVSWCGYALAQRHRAWGLLAGIAATLAFFSKAAAAFYLAALAIECAWALGSGRLVRGRVASEQDVAARRAAAWTIGGLIGAGLVSLALFVVPFWTEFRFYNWQMSVTRKPAYSVKAFLDRASWLPIVHDFFTRMWFLTLAALSACAGLLMRWRTAPPPERLLGWWIVLGAAELLVHDVGNERRLVFFIPALAALTALVLDRGNLFGREASPPVGATAIGRLSLLPLLLYAAYIAVGPLARLPFLYEVRPGVRTAATVAALCVALLYWRWNETWAWLGRHSWTPRAAAGLVVLVMAGDVAQFWQWAAARTYENVTASRAIGEWLAPGTLVHGKLANGLALENRIRPIFVGRGFGNYEDRARRPDIQYVLTYVHPRLGYEGSVILDVLAAHSGWRILRTFDVAETGGGADRAALIEKPPATSTAPGNPRAQD